MKSHQALFLSVFIIGYTIIVLRLFSNVNEIKSVCLVSREHDILWQKTYGSAESLPLKNARIIQRTFKFQIEEVNEDDAELVEYVKSIIVPPSTKPLNLKDNNKIYFSQIGQDKYIDDLLKQKTNGFFIEAGAYEGEALSNTLYFEMKRNWSGLLIEPLPDLFRSVVSKNRKAYAINACISSGKPYVANFKVCDALSGKVDTMTDEHKKRIEKSGEFCKSNYDIQVPCFSLKTILMALNVKKIDYFSLDVEGGEYDILKDLKLNEYPVVSFTVEYNGFKEIGDKITNYLTGNNYKLTKKDGQDLYFLRNDFF
jgi:FkbM family methyltransferase